MLFALALFPIALILFLMLGLRWGAARAGGAGYLSALMIAILFFGADLDLLAYAHAKALLLSVDVLLIIWAAFLLYRVADEAGAIRTIGQALPHLTNDTGMQALVIGWVFATFLQGVGGFGVPVAVIAPLLVSLGFSPLAAVVIPSIGHGWAVTFGSLGSSFQALIAATGVPGELLAPPTALFLGVAGLCSGWLVAHSVQGWQAMKRLAVPVLLLGVVMGGVSYVVAVSGLWNIASFVAGMAGLVVCFPLAKRFQGEKGDNGKLDVGALLVALSGYAILITVILIVQLLPPVKQFLNQVVLQVHFPEVSTRLGFVTPAGVGRKISIFGHTGVVLFYSSILAYIVYWKAGLYQAGAIRKILSGTFYRVLPSSVSILSMVTMAVIMENAGMTDALARGLAVGLGGIYPFVAPWIGALGAFMTGSNTNSNVVFGGLQLQTAVLLGYPAAIILAAQTAGASLASVIAPTKVAVGASTAGMAGREGDVMRKLILYTGALVLVVSVLTVVAVRMM
jgi:lactate permease